jgi:hypothetical protein
MFDYYIFQVLKLFSLYHLKVIYEASIRFPTLGFHQIVENLTMGKTKMEKLSNEVSLNDLTKIFYTLKILSYFVGLE